MRAIVAKHATGVRFPLRVLVADDNELIRAAVRGLLRNLGHSVAVAADGREAVELATSQEFDLIFLDIQMPQMGGLEASRALGRLRRGGRRARIIGLSGERENRETTEAAGMDEFLIKPVVLAELIRVLERGALRQQPARSE